MALYKRIAGATDEATLAREAAAAEDRYGAAPPAFAQLLEIARLRLFARALGVQALQRRGDELAATLEKDHGLDPSKVLDAPVRGRAPSPRAPMPSGSRRRLRVRRRTPSSSRTRALLARSRGEAAA